MLLQYCEEFGSKRLLIGLLVNKIKDVYSLNPLQLHLELTGAPFLSLRADMFCFSVKCINYEKAFISGYYYNHNEQTWKRKYFPYPDIIYLYNTLPKLSDADIRQFKEMVNNYRVRLVNNLLEFNKWELHKTLSRNPQIKPHLPDTVLGQSPENLEHMLQRYGSVYLKACRGRKGLQVMQVKMLPHQNYQLHYFADRPISKQVKGSGRLINAINGFFRGKKFIIQQPIDLIEYGGNKVDLRAEMQRNGRGKVEIVAVPVRVAEHHSPITTHASSYPFDYFFSELMNYSEDSIADLKNGLYTLLLAIYLSIEDIYGTCGELGLDMGLDNKGKLWFIESNPVSARVSLIKAYDDHTVSQVFANPIEYALFSAGYN